MFRFIEKNKTVVKVILIILAITFITFGISSFSSMLNENYIVKLKDENITEYAIKNVLNSQNKDYSTQNIKEIYNLLLNRAYLLQGSKKMGLSIVPSEIQQFLYSIDIFRNKDGVFDINLFKKYLKNTKQSETQFVNSIKKEIYLKNLMDIFNNGLIVSDIQNQAFINALFAKKEMQQLLIPNKIFFDKINPSDDQLKKFYQNHVQKYIQATAAKFEYIKISPETLLPMQNVTSDEIKEYFDQVKKTFPQRIVYSILIAFPESSQLNPTMKEKLKQKAQVLRQAILSNPNNFEQLAKKYSDDKVSAIDGGKLGLISKNGQLLKSLEDVAFNLNIGEISDIVESNYGFHILKTTLAVNGEDLIKEKDSISYLIKQNKAYAELNHLKTRAAEISFDNPHELDSTSKAIGIKINKFDTWITQNNAKKYNIPQKVIDNLFSQDVFQQKNNSDLIDINNHESWIIRVLDTRKKQQIPFNNIKNAVINDYKNYKVKDLVKLETQKTILALQQGKNNAKLPWSKAEDIDYQIAKHSFNDNELNKFIDAKPTNNHPIYFLLENDTGCIIIRVNKIILPENINTEDYKNLVQQNLFALELYSFLQKQKAQFKIKKGKQKLSDIN